MPDLSIIIPTHQRPSRISACVRALAAQALDPARFEVLVGLDGPDDHTEDAIARAWPGAPALHVLTCPREGYNAVRNRLLEIATGRTIVSLNDDVIPAPDFLATHLREQHLAQERNTPSIITGHSPWVVHHPDRLFDRLVRESPMVFFHADMRAQPDRDWGYRYAWGLNVSMPAWMVKEVGGWTAFPLAYGYDDIELAWRLHHRFNIPVLHRPAALAPHDHRMEPDAYLARERSLGWSAYHFARANPAFAQDLFGRDITSPEELAYSREYVQRERVGVDRLRDPFLKLAGKPADAVTDPDVLHMLYQQHLPLKRWEWRTGLLEASCTPTAPQRTTP